MLYIVENKYYICYCIVKLILFLMKEKIYPKTINGKVYYYLQRTYREKIDANIIGKTKDSGKSKVKTKSTYLGTASSIRGKLINIKEPLDVKYKEFGLVGAVYNVAEEIGMVEILKKNIKGTRYGIDNWVYFLLAIINRIDNSTSKEKMGNWATGTILPDILNFDPSKLNSKSFWYASDDVISEKELQDKREEKPEIKKEVLTGIEEGVLKKIEKEIIKNIKNKYDLSSNIFLYDTTNFFTFFQEPTRSLLARSAKSKAGRNNLKHIGLALSVDRQWGIPLFHSVYRANSHDTKTFYEIITDLTSVLKTEFDGVENMVLIIDKGNNSKDNFEKLNGNIEWVGSLKISDYTDLTDFPLNHYDSNYKDFKYFQTQKEVMGVKLKLVITYNEKLYRKQLHSLESGINRLEEKIRNKWSEYKRPQKTVPKGVKNILSQSYYKDYVTIRCKKGKLIFSKQQENIDKKKKKFGKTILFGSNLEKESSNIIEQYHSKDKVEDGFKILKDPHLISWRPMRHWTDSKIQIFAFCNVLALMLIRIMEYKATINNIKMSPHVLKQELKDLKKVILIYNEKTARTKITHRSTVQKQLWDIFKLDTLKK